jgi:hypothetical protein
MADQNEPVTLSRFTVARADQMCAGCMTTIPVGAEANVDADGFVWCLHHTAADIAIAGTAADVVATWPADDRRSTCHRDAHRPGLPAAGHGNPYTAPK